MVIYINDDSAYLSWLGHHRDGFVLDAERRPAVKCRLLHRALCSAVRERKSKRTRLTTRRRIKVCALDLQELQNWAVEETGGEAELCPRCAPGKPVSLDRKAAAVKSAGNGQLTKLGAAILDYVLDAAVIDLDNELAYDLTVGEVAQGLGRSTPQITASLRRLVEQEMIAVGDGETAPRRPLADRPIYPTQRALRKLPAFAHMSARQLKRELAHLQPRNEQA